MIPVKREDASGVDTIGGKVQHLEEHEGIFAQLSVSCKGGLDIIAVYFWH